MVIADLGVVSVSSPESSSTSSVSRAHKEVVDSVANHATRSPAHREDVPSPFSDDLVAVKTIVETSSLIPVVTPIEPYYFSIGDLTEAPRVTLDLSPSLAFSLPNGLAQIAILRLLINEQGAIDQVFIDDSPLSADDQRLVIDTFSKTKFQPGEINEIPVKSQLKIEVRLDAGFDSQ